MTAHQIFDALTVGTLIVLVVTVFMQGRTISGMIRTERSASNIVQTINRTWTHHAWRVHDIAAAAGLQLPRPPYPRIPIQAPEDAS